MKYILILLILTSCVEIDNPECVDIDTVFSHDTVFFNDTIDLVHYDTVFVTKYDTVWRDTMLILINGLRDTCLMNDEYIQHADSVFNNFMNEFNRVNNVNTGY